MLIKRIAFVLPLFLLFIFNPTFALETTGTFKIITDKNEVIISKEVSFEEGETLYEVTKRAFDIKEANGNIISINGINSIPEENIHWAAFVNREFVEVGLDEVNLFANDDVVWALRDYDNKEILK